MKGSPTKTVCFFNSNKAWGGGEKWHFSTAMELKRRGHNTILVTNLRSQLRDKAVNERLNVYSFKIGNLSFLNPLKLLVLYFFFKAKKVDTIIMNLPADLKSAGIAAKLAGVKNIMYRRGMPHPLRSTWLNRFLFQKVLTKVIVNSEEIGRSLSQDNESWFPKEKMVLVYNGVDTNARIDTSKIIYKKKNNEFVIGNAGRLTSQKGQKYLLEMAEILKTKNVNFHLLIAGEGELKSSLLELIKTKNLQDHVTMLGHVTDMAAFMNSLDLFVFPSLFEGSANTLIETLFYKKPIIAFDVSSNPEIIQHGVNGLLAKAFDSKELTECVERLMNSHQLREEFVSNGEKIVREKFDNKKLIQVLESTL
ncbi:MAG: glycosyltransferase [Bdellovibrionales bacterium]|nr:glycosyltransferase [Bdellovibrionales bacterium]